MARYQKGQSGNPKGRIPGVGETGRLRAELAQHLPTAIRALIEKVNKGDIAAIRILLDRVLPPLKAVSRSVPIELPTGLAAQGRTVVAALGRGEIAPEEAGSIMQAVLAQARVIEVAELERRVKVLEETQSDKPI